MISSLSIFFSAAVVSLLLTFPVVWLLKIFKLGQPVRVEGPPSHQTKAGTPTMGGLGFILTILSLSLILLNFEFHLEYLALILLVAAYAAIGLADDVLKITRHQNLGLTFREKILSQVACAGLFSLVLIYLGHNHTYALLYLFWAVFVIVGSANATNLTDGLNGLLAGTSSIAFTAFAVSAAGLHNSDAATFCLVSAGAVFAFLYFNFPGARVFMGDVGSLPIGAALGGIAIILHKEFLLAMIGGVFVIEALSVIIQVASYRFFKRRIFRMSPLHHHFELMGINETWVTIGFWVVGLILGIVGVMI